MEHSGLPKAKQKPINLEPTTKHDIKQFDKLYQLKDNIYDFVANGNNLYITSEITGNGKTSWAIKLLHKYFEKVWEGNCLKVRGMFVHVPTFLLDVKNFKSPLNPEYIKYLKTCDLIVWDDIACEMLSNYDITQLTALIDGRILAEKSNIYTGNIVNEDDMKDILGDRLASRIYKASTVIELVGGDKRNDRSSSTSNNQ